VEGRAGGIVVPRPETDYTQEPVTIG